MMLAAFFSLLLGPDPLDRAFSLSARRVIAQPIRVTIYAIDPSAHDAKPRGFTRDGGVRTPNFGFRDAVAARRLAPVEAKRVTNALFSCLRDVSDKSLMYSCFDPHHGLKFERGQKWVKVWVCFICRGVEVQESGGREAMVGTGLAGKATFDRLVPKVGRKRVPIKARP